MNRNNSVNLLKTTAVFFVVAVHFLLNTQYYDLIVNNNLMVIGIFFRCLFITCVPFFLIATGFLMNKKTLSNQYILGILPLIIKYILLSLIVWLSCKVFFNDPMTLSEGIKGIFDYSTISYSWYIEMYLGLYFLIPFLNIIWWYNDKKNYHLYIIFLNIILVFLPSLINVFGKVLPDYWQLLYPIAYYFIGCFFAKYENSIKKVSFSKIVKLLLLLLIIFTVINVNHSWNKEFQWTNGNDYFGYQPFLIAIILFVFIWKIKIHPVFLSLLDKISRATICIYLISEFTDKVTYSFVDKIFRNQDIKFMYGPLIIIIDFIFAALLGCLFNTLMNKVINCFKFRKEIKL